MDEEIEVTMARMAEGVHGGVGFMATVPILGGTRKAAGLGISPEEALRNLVVWLAGAATEVDIHHGEMRRDG